MKRPNLFIWLPLGLLVKVFSFFKGQRVRKTVTIKGPAITLSNHTSFYDFLYTTSVIYPRRTNYLAAKKMFYDPLLGFFLRLARAIPKALLEPDPVATIQALKIIKKGGILSIFPEGQISASGVLLEPSFAIAKLIKKANVPVYLIKHYNVYFVNPPWTKKSFSGRINTEVKLLLSSEEIVKFSDQQIFERIYHELFHNPHQYNQIKKYAYHVGNIHGLEHLLYQCPQCGKDGLQVEKSTLNCPHCQHQATLNKWWQLGDSSVYEYHEFQRHYLEKQLSEQAEFKLSSAVTLQSFRGKKVVNVGRGHLKLSLNGYAYLGTIDDQNVELHFDPKRIPSLPSDIGQNVQIYKNGQLYQFVFTDKIMPTKFVLLSEIIYKKLNAN